MATPKPAPSRPPRDKPDPQARQQRNGQDGGHPRWHRHADRVAAYGSKGLGTGTTVATAFVANSPWITAGVAVLGGALDTFSVWWGRYKRRKGSDADK